MPSFSNVQAGARSALPLYLQVKQSLLAKMISGEWPAGSILPSEQMLGTQLGVSQGTVRKALDALAAENLVVRRQGKGTFVSQHDQHRTLFQFFKIVDNHGNKKFPETEFCRLVLEDSLEDERRKLELSGDSKVWRLFRHRALGGSVVMIENITLSEEMFPELDVHDPLPNNVYRLYERHYNKTIARAVEQVRAVKASKDEAAVLQCRTGDPLLQIDRLARGLDARPVELRQSVCLTTHFCYLSDLT